MKLIVTADDYGMTPAITDGIITCIREGVLTQTGMFTNMPCSAYAAKRMLSEYPDFCLGQDINFTTGYPISKPDLIPTMVQENGAFLTSKRHRELDKADKHHVKYEEAYTEAENQIKRFIELTGKRPDYIGGHAYGSDEINQVIRDIAEKYGVIKKREACAAIETDPNSNVAMQWSTPRLRDDGSYDFGVDIQLRSSPLEMFVNGEIAYFGKALKEDGIVHIHTHCGFVDAELVRLSSFHMIRMMEADFICSAELKKWVKDNRVELVSLKDIERR